MSDPAALSLAEKLAKAATTTPLRERLAATEDFTDIVIDALEAADKELTMLQDRGHDHVRSDVLDRVRQVLDRLNELNEPSPE